MFFGLLSSSFFSVVVRTALCMDMAEFHSPAENLDCFQCSPVQTVVQSAIFSVRLSLHIDQVDPKDKGLVPSLVKDEGILNVD